MKRIIIVGSPRSDGRSSHLAEMLFEANIDERPEDELFLVPVSEIEVGPCIGCGGCRELSPVTFKGDDGQEYTDLRPRCVFDDDMQTLYDLLDEADEVTVVSPIYFSGAPAPLKCILDRLQPYFWAGTRKAPKRAATLHVVGEGGDPHGHDALLSEVKSSLAVAGFRLGRVFDWVGKITPEGDITAEAAESEVSWGKPAGSGREAGPDGSGAAETPPSEAEVPVRRPAVKLDLYGTGGGASGNTASGKARGGSARGGKRDSSSGRGAQQGTAGRQARSPKPKGKPKGKGGRRG